MSIHVDQLVDAATKLSEAEQLEIVQRILGHEKPVSDAWKAEIDRRMILEESGEIEYRPIEELQQRLHQKYETD